MRHHRDYGKIAGMVRSSVKNCQTVEDRMARMIDLLWEELKGQGLAWAGFYRMSDDEKEMLLVCRQPKPACSPIGLHGVCGKAWRERKAQVVADVHALGEGHIVCDPDNLSEVVVPVLEKDGRCRYVLDLDSREPDSFSQDDVAGLELVLESAGL